MKENLIPSLKKTTLEKIRSSKKTKFLSAIAGVTSLIGTFSSKADAAPKINNKPDSSVNVESNEKVDPKIKSLADAFDKIHGLKEIISDQEYVELENKLNDLVNHYGLDPKSIVIGGSFFVEKADFIDGEKFPSGKTFVTEKIEGERFVLKIDKKFETIVDINTPTRINVSSLFAHENAKEFDLGSPEAVSLKNKITDNLKYCNKSQIDSYLKAINIQSSQSEIIKNELDHGDNLTVGNALARGSDEQRRVAKLRGDEAKKLIRIAINELFSQRTDLTQAEKNDILSRIDNINVSDACVSPDGTTLINNAMGDTRGTFTLNQRGSDKSKWTVKVCVNTPTGRNPIPSDYRDYSPKVFNNCNISLPTVKVDEVFSGVDKTYAKTESSAKLEFSVFNADAINKMDTATTLEGLRSVVVAKSTFDLKEFNSAKDLNNLKENNQNKLRDVTVGDLLDALKGVSKTGDVWKDLDNVDFQNKFIELCVKLTNKDIGEKNGKLILENLVRAKVLDQAPTKTIYPAQFKAIN